MRAVLVETRDLAPEIRHFTFAVPEVARLEYQAGQFASLTAPVNGRDITRAYSLAAAPRGDNRFEICLNRVADGLFSPFLFDLAPGDQVECKGILGTFVWREPAMDAILVATGTGVVPFRALLQEQFRGPATRQITLIQGTRQVGNLLFRNEFEAWEQIRPEFRYIPTLTRPDPGWEGATGRVQQLVENSLAGRTDVQVYVCGLKEMVDSVRAMAKQYGLDRRQIISEKYD